MKAYPLQMKVCLLRMKVHLLRGLKSHLVVAILLLKPFRFQLRSTPYWNLVQIFVNAGRFAGRSISVSTESLNRGHAPMVGMNQVPCFPLTTYSG